MLGKGTGLGPWSKEVGEVCSWEPEEAAGLLEEDQPRRRAL